MKILEVPNPLCCGLVLEPPDPDPCNPLMQDTPLWSKITRLHILFFVRWSLSPPDPECCDPLMQDADYEEATKPGGYGAF